MLLLLRQHDSLLTWLPGKLSVGTLTTIDRMNLKTHMAHSVMMFAWCPMFVCLAVSQTHKRMHTQAHARSGKNKHGRFFRCSMSPLWLHVVNKCTQMKVMGTSPRLPYLGQCVILFHACGHPDTHTHTHSDRQCPLPPP